MTKSSTLGNTALDGTWLDMGTTTIGGTAYHVYNHSTTQAQVLVANATVNTTAAAQSVSINFAQVDSKTHVDEFAVLAGSTVAGVAASSVETDAWVINSATAANVATSGLMIRSGTESDAAVDAYLGTDTHLRMSNGNIYTFTSKTGPFNTVSFKSTSLNFQSVNPVVVEFFDAAGVLLTTTPWYVANDNTATATFSTGLVAATSFKLHTAQQTEVWFMDELSTTMIANSTVTSGSTIIDTTPRLTGAYTALASGEVVQIFEGTTYLGTATVDATSKTWVYQLGTSSIGTHTYTAKISTASGALISSNDFTVNLASSPLVLDLNGDGVQTLGIEQGVQFDLLATGTSQSVGWIDSHDGLLTLDLNGDGLINSGAELLGTSTLLADGSFAKDGWDALRQYDANHDGQIDAADAVFNKLNVWVDADTDGTTDTGELKSLADLGIASISLNANGTQTAQNGNILAGYSSFTTTDGQSHQMVDAWLQTQNLPVLNLDALVHDQGVVNLGNGKAELLQLNVSDVLQLPTNTSGQHVLQVQGDATDVVSLSHLFADGHASGTWGQTGTSTQNGQTYNVYQYSGDTSLQVLVDQNIAQSQVHVS